MAGPSEKELKVPGTQADEISSTNPDHSSDSDDERIEKLDEKDTDDISESKELEEDEAAKGTELRAAVTSASLATTMTRVTTVQPPEEEKKKPWHKKLNPLRWGSPPPVPKEKIVSREYQASFLSMLTFQWMAPLMTVSKPCLARLRC
jgi:hypothetical protein